MLSFEDFVRLYGMDEMSDYAYREYVEDYYFQRCTCTKCTGGDCTDCPNCTK